MSSFIRLQRKKQKLNKQKLSLEIAKKQVRECQNRLSRMQRAVEKKGTELEKTEQVVDKHRRAAQKKFGEVHNPLATFLLGTHQGMQAPILSRAIMHRLESNDLKQLKSTCKLFSEYIDDHCKVTVTKNGYYKTSAGRWEQRYLHEFSLKC